MLMNAHDIHTVTLLMATSIAKEMFAHISFTYVYA